MKNNMLVVGKGYIGTRVSDYLGCALVDERIESVAGARALVDRYQPRTIINCIGHTGSRNVDDCELDKDKTIFANTFVPIILAEMAVRHRIRLVHISSGCIYHYDYANDRPLTETRVPDFFDLYYSRSKIYAERALEVLCRRYPILIVRIRIPLDDRPHPRNTLTKLLRYAQVIDLPNSVTYIPDFLKALKFLIKGNARGIYNVVSPGGLRYPQLLEMYKKYVPGFSYKTIDHRKLRLIRTNLLMSTAKLRKAGFTMRPVQAILDECIRHYLAHEKENQS